MSVSVYAAVIPVPVCFIVLYSSFFTNLEKLFCCCGSRGSESYLSSACWCKVHEQICVASLQEGQLLSARCRSSKAQEARWEQSFGISDFRLFSAY